MHPVPPRSFVAVVALCLGLAVLPLQAQAADAPPKIRDNLFLLEEAYNQEPGVIQHISVFERAQDGAWTYAFTEEWPVPDETHQLSVTLPLQDGGDEPVALGDVLVNYRWQAMGLGNDKLALAPRASIVLPTGDADKGFGRGGPGLQLNLPASYDNAEHWVLHANAGLTWTPQAKGLGTEQSTVDTNLGAAVVWLPVTWFNALVEVLHETHEGIVVAAVGQAGTPEIGTQRHSAVTVNPGVRFAIDVGKLQIVPGVSAPIDLDSGDVGVLGYLSFEHPLW